MTPTPRFFHERVRALVKERAAAIGEDWKSIVFDRTHELLRAQDLEAIEKELLAGGHRFAYSATISIQESPEKYQPKGAGESAAAAEADAEGRVEVGSGDNLVTRPEHLRGVARFLSTLDQVTAMLVDGVPEDTIAVIDDSGGTLTAPILEGFRGVVCLGGTVRSHLGILTREYGIPCFMNCKIPGELAEGDAVEMELTAPAVTAEDYESGTAVRARIWRMGKASS